jgi:hypothetical protein
VVDRLRAMRRAGEDESGRRPQSRLWLGVYRGNLPRIRDFNQTATWRLCFMGEQQDKRPVDGAKGGSAQPTAEEAKGKR